MRAHRRSIALLAVLTLALALPVLAQAPDRSAPPAPGPPPALKLPEIQKRALSNGLPVRIVEVRKVPIVQIDLLVLSGAGSDPAGKYGVASMVAAMLDEGAGTRSALEIADAIDYLGASLTTGSSFDTSVVGLWVPVARLADALPIMADVALRPTFPPPELERLRKERLTAMLQSRDDPRSIAELAFPRIVFGGQNRYGTSAAGTPDAVKSFTVDDLRSFYRTCYRPDNAAIIVVGDVKADSLMPQLEAAFGGWKGEGPSTPAISVPNAPQLAARQVYIIDKPGAPQSQIRIGGVGVPRSTPDYFAVQVLNTILGGSFTSRLNQNLREQHGYTYGAGSSFAMRRSAGPFVASSGVQTEVTADALKEFFNELSGILRPVPSAELSRARSYVALRFPGEFETAADIARKLEESIVYGLPEDYFATYVSRIEAVSEVDLQRAAQKYILPARFAVVIVGDRKAIEAGVRALNLGPVKVMTIQDALGPAVPVE